MPKHIYKNRQREVFELLQAGKYYFKVLDAREGMQAQGVTNGAPFLEVRIGFANRDGKLTTAFWEKLIFHESIEWKVDRFLESIHWEGLEPDQELELDIKPVDTIGRRGLCEIEVNRYTDKSGQPRENNRIKQWLIGDKFEIDTNLRAEWMEKNAPADPFGSSAPASPFPPTGDTAISAEPYPPF